MARRQRAANEGLVAKWNVKDGAAARNEEPFVAVRNEEIGIELREIERDVADAVCTIDYAQDAEMAACLGQGLEWHADSRHGGDGVEDTKTGIVAGSSLLFDACSERGCEEGIGDWVRVLDFYCFHWRCFGHVCHRFLACAVDCGEVDDLVSRLERKIAQDGIDTCRGIWNVRDCVNRSIEVVGNSSSRFVQ